VVAGGRLADLVVTNGDPAKDIRVLTRPNHIELVVLGGRVVRDLTEHAVPAV